MSDDGIGRRLYKDYCVSMFILLRLLQFIWAIQRTAVAESMRRDAVTLHRPGLGESINQISSAVFAVCLSLPYAIMHCRCANSLHVDCIIRRLIYSYFKHSCCLPTSVNARRHCLTTSPDWKCLWHVYVSTGRNVLAVVHYRPGSAYSAYEPVLRWFRRRCGACVSYACHTCHARVTVSY